MTKYPNVTIKILIRHKNKVLILRHKDGIYDFPGGQLEFRESLEEGLKREIKEELDYDFNVKPELIHVWNYISRDRQRHSVMIYYIYIIDKKPKFSSPEKLEVLWLNKKDMKDIISDHDFVERIYSWKENRK